MNTTTQTQVRLYASARAWIEGEAVRQLYDTARLDGVRLAVGFPDLHPGKGTPVGAAFVTQGVIYPHLIGGDIGCGMALFATDLVRRDAKLDRWAKLSFDLEHPDDSVDAERLADCGLESTAFDAALGTLGGGNHFAEVQTIESVADAEGLKAFGLGKHQLAILVHSGSRGLGESVLRSYVDSNGGDGTDPEWSVGSDYLRGHDHAVRWAEANRTILARRFAAQLGAGTERLWDGCHNGIMRVAHKDDTLWIHRKGAVEAHGSFVVVPGSRGSWTYLLKPRGNGVSHAWSLAHGAGRKWSRSESRLRMRERFGPLQLAQTRLGGRVICEERDLLYEEAPDAYKDVDAVVQDLVDAGLASVVATLRPLLTYKTRKRRR